MTLWLSLVTTVGIQMPTFKGLLKCITSASSKVMHPNSRLRSEFRHTPMWGIVGLGDIQDCCDIEFCSFWSLSTFYLVEQLNHPRVLERAAQPISDPASCASFFFPPRQGLESLQHSGRAQGFAILQRKSLESCCFGAHGYILGIPSANVLVSPGVPWHRRWKVIQATSTSSPLSQGKTLLLLVVYQVTYSQVPPSSISNLYAEA